MTAKPHEAIRITGTINATEIALDELGIPAFNTCMVGAFTAITGWIEINDVLSCLESYFKGDALEKNQRCVERGYQEVKKVEWERQIGITHTGRRPKMPAPVSAESPWTQQGLFRDMKVGNWRYQRPKKNEEQCCQCGWCLLLCPTGCVMNNHGNYRPNMDYCKGCGICAEECPVHAIKMVREGI
jgi:pyruvate ferredoxin oxidoreductase delta subunit